jgi:hypothetical protein
MPVKLSIRKVTSAEPEGEVPAETTVSLEEYDRMLDLFERKYQPSDWVTFWHGYIKQQQKFRGNAEQAARPQSGKTDQPEEQKK